MITKPPLHILLLEDSAADAELAQDILEADGIHCDVVRVQTRAEFVGALQDRRFDLILADYSLPSFDGVSALKLALEARPDLPFIFVSGTLGEEVAISRSALAACGQGQSQPKSAAPPPPQVTVAKPVTRQIADQDEFVGRFVAVESVEVRARVSGYLEAIHFQDGQIVRKGDLLFTIDRRPFETALAQAQASLEQAKANLAFAEADLQRAQNVAIGTVITQQTFDQRTQAKRVAQANVAAQEQAVRQAALDLEFSELRAPVDGRIGDRRVSVGNLVTGGTAGTTLLATIESVDPIRFEFTMDERLLPALRAPRQGQGRRRRPRPHRAGEGSSCSTSRPSRTPARSTSSTTRSAAPPARSAPARCSPIRTAPSRPACSRACRWRRRRRRIRCWCRRPRSAPSRPASSC